MMDYDNIPEYAPVLRKLLKGSLSMYQEKDHWEIMLRYRSVVEDWLTKIGIELFIDETEGYAFVRDPEPPDDYTGPRLPALMSSHSLDYKTTVLCVILREKLLEHDQRSLVAGGRPVITKSDIYDEMAGWLKQDSAASKFRYDINRTIGGLEKMKLIREVKDQEDTYYIERIIKARINAEALEDIRQKLIEQTDSDDELDI